MSQKNWFGLPNHYTDRFIGWWNREKDAIEIAARNRVIYDRLVAKLDEAGIKDLHDMIDEGYQSGYDNAESDFQEICRY